MRGPRSNPEQPFTGYPAHGAVHEVIPTQKLREFLSSFAEIADKVFEQSFDAEQSSGQLVIVNSLEGEIDEEERYNLTYREYNSRQYFTTFNAERMGLSIYEMKRAAKIARATRTVWEKHDLGAVEQDAKNEIYRHFPDFPPKLVFDRIINVGGKLPQFPKSDVTQKIAMAPNPSKNLDTFNLINFENEKVEDAIFKRLKQDAVPWSFVPHLTFAAFRHKAKPTDIAEIIEAIDHILSSNPIELTLGRLIFRRELERRKRS